MSCALFSFCLVDCCFKGSSSCVHTLSMRVLQVLSWTSLIINNEEKNTLSKHWPVLVPTMGLCSWEELISLFCQCLACSSFHTSLFLAIVYKSDFYHLSQMTSFLTFRRVSNKIPAWKCHTDPLGSTYQNWIHTHKHTHLLHTYIQILPFRDTTVHSCVSWKSGICSPSLSSFRLNLPLSSVLPVQCSLSPPISLFPMHVLGCGPPSFFLWTLVTGLCWLSVIWFKCKFKWAVFLPLALVVLVHTSLSSGVMLMIGVPDEAWMMPGVPGAG